MPPFDKTRLIGNSPAYRSMIEQIEQVAPLDVSLLLLGETGVGKSAHAEYLHHLSPRSKGSFQEINCSALAENLIEDELFGHEKGAFTDAKERRAGLFELAHGGTLFLDEIGDMSQALQAKLLRVLETKQVRRLGGCTSIDCDVRFVYATNGDLTNLRADLLFRMDEARVTVPTLRERREDIPALVEYFFSLMQQKMARTEAFKIDDAAMQVFCGHTWPGNIRDLRNVILKIALSCKTTPLITPEDVGRVLRRRVTDNPPDPDLLAVEDTVALTPDELLRSAASHYRPGEQPLDTFLSGVFLNIYNELLRVHKTHAAVARLLGLDRTTLYARLKLARAVVEAPKVITS